MLFIGRLALGVSCVVAILAACSGQSERAGSGGSGGGEPTGGSGGGEPTGGSGGGEPTGGSAGDRACVPGETQACFGPGRCEGAQVCSLDGSRWEACDCGTGGTAGSGGSAGGAGDGGAGGQPDPFGMCPVPPLVVGTTCSFEATCEALSCGSATSLHGQDGCLRPTCRSADDCAAGERCLPAPVAGEIRDCWSSGCETCEESGGDCGCVCFEDCSKRAVCVPSADFPPEDDCPTAGLTCGEVRRAIENVEDYVEAGDPSFEDEPLELLESCRDTLRAAEPPACDFCEIWNAGRLEQFPQTASAAVTEWSAYCEGATVGLARGCDFTAVWRFGHEDRNFKEYYLYDGTGAVIGFYRHFLGGDQGCDRSTARTGAQLECYDAISDFCDPTVRQLFSLDKQVSCETLELCEVCGNGDYPTCEDVP